MNKWNSRNLIKKRDFFELKQSLEENYQLLKEVNEKLDRINKNSNENLREILEKCQESQQGYENVEMLLKTLMVDSLLKGIENE